jgi:hypothetical protein
MSLVTVYRFEVQDVMTGEWVLSTRMATRASIENKFKGLVLQHTAHQIDDLRLDQFDSIHLDSWGRLPC